MNVTRSFNNSYRANVSIQIHFQFSDSHSVLLASLIWIAQSHACCVHMALIRLSVVPILLSTKP